MLQFLLTVTDESKHKNIEYIYNTFHDSMMKYAVSKFGSIGSQNVLYDAEDAVQNAFMKISKYIDNIDFSRNENDIKNYCFTILSNEICAIIKNNEEIFEIVEEFCLKKEYNYIDELELRDNYNKVVKAIEALDEKYSTTLYLIFCKEMTVNEIADMMGISPKTVYTRLYRGKHLLLDTLKGETSNGKR